MIAKVDVDELLGKARLIVRAGAPYFRSALVSLVPRSTDGLGTIGVTERGVLMYDPEWLVQFPADVVAGALVHEILHVLHKHTTGRRGHRNHVLFNAASDLAINPTVLEMGFKLPDGKNHGMFPKDFGWPEGETAEQYYDRLMKAADGLMKKVLEHIGEHQCGSGAGNPFEQEPKDDGGKGKGQGGDNADGESDFEGRTDAQLARVAQQVANAIEQHAAQKGRGSMPAGLERWAKDMLTPPKVPWRAMLQRALRAEVAFRPGASVHRYDGPSRRQAGIGYGEGKPIFPRLRQPVPRVAFLLDTSGSMSDEQLGLATSEANGVLRATGADITFAVCDAAMHGMKSVKSAGEMLRMLKGGGGSDFTPAFEELAKQHPRPEIVIAATDGDITVPKSAPTWARVVWLLVGKGTRPPAPWGTAVMVDGA